jgi:hypothetical protein
MRRFLGRLMGASLLRDASLELDLAGIVWKGLLGQRPVWADLEEVDEAFCREVTAGRGASEAEWAAGRRRWTVATSTGRRAELRPGGALAAVAYEERGAYLDACVAYRLGEGRRQVEAMRGGFLRLVPGCGTEMADWRAVERMVCGTPVIDVAVLKRMTDYSGMPGGEAHPVAALFWRVMEGASNEDRAQARL